MADLYAQGEAFISDSMPLPVCKRVRAWRCKKVRGKAVCGYCAANKEKFCGGRLPLICTRAGIPVRFDLRPAAEQDLTPSHDLTVALPNGSTVFGDTGSVSDPEADTIFSTTGLRLRAVRRRTMTPHAWAEDYALRLYRNRIETVYSQLAALGIQQLHARTNHGFDLNAYASLLALAFTNIFPD